MRGAASLRVLLLVLASCTSGGRLPAVRFANAPPVQAVNDRVDVPHKPAEIPYVRTLYNFDGQFFRRLTRALELHRPQRARGVNALDEVPDSTWFTNRIGVRELSPDEIAAGPAGVGSPEGFKPWTVVSTKVGGMTTGFVIKDSRGEKFLLKFDPRGRPEAETATQIIMGRLMWAFGLNVTEDYVMNIRDEDLVLAPDAAMKDVFGSKKALTREELERRLATVERGLDGSMRVMVSHWLAGKPLGGHWAEGVREDDPNDRIPHELRRDLRGLYVLFAWLDHVDIHRGNMLDVWTTDPADTKRHYVKHYWVDYGIGLGFGASKNDDPRYGYEWYSDVGAMLRSLLTLGVYERAWEPRQHQNRRGVGMLEDELFDPGSWKSSTPAYVPIYVADRFDKFWAAKILIRFTREQLQAAVDSARLSDPAAAAWLVDTLIARQRATAKYWFERVNPLDRFVIDGDHIWFDDLSIIHGFSPAGSTRYTLETFTPTGTPLHSYVFDAQDGGVTCAPLALAAGKDGYTILRFTTRRSVFTGTTYVHVARDPVTHAPRVIGLWRE